MTLNMIEKSPMPKANMATTKMRDMEGLKKMHMAMDTTSVIGALVAMMSAIWKAFCTLVTSVVILVTRPAVENLSMFLKE